MRALTALIVVALLAVPARAGDALNGDLHERPDGSLVLTVPHLPPGVHLRVVIVPLEFETQLAYHRALHLVGRQVTVIGEFLPDGDFLVWFLFP